MIRSAMARGTLVLDENVLVLREGLRRHNFRVFTAPQGTPDDVIIETMMNGRVLVTNNLADFEYMAEAFEFGIVNVTMAALADPQRVVDEISRAFIDHRLKRQAPFVFTIGVADTNFRLLDVDEDD